MWVRSLREAWWGGSDSSYLHVVTGNTFEATTKEERPSARHNVLRTDPGDNLQVRPSMLEAPQQHQRVPLTPARGPSSNPHRTRAWASVDRGDWVPGAAAELKEGQVCQIVVGAAYTEA